MTQVFRPEFSLWLKWIIFWTAGAIFGGLLIMVGGPPVRLGHPGR